MLENVRKIDFFWISRSLRYTVIFWSWNLPLMAIFQVILFLLSFLFPFFLGLPLFQSLQRYLFYHVDRCFWLIMRYYVVSMAVAHDEQHMNKFYLFEFHVNLNLNLGVRSKRDISRFHFEELK